MGSEAAFVDVTRVGVGNGRLGATSADLQWTATLGVQTRLDLTPAQLEQRVLNSARVKATVTRIVSEGIMNERACRECTRQVLNEMAATVKPALLYPLGLGARQLLRNLYRGGINVNKDGIERIKTALKSGPVILLPTHRSHMDYIAIQFAAVANQLPVPFVIAGDNLNFPIIGRILKSAGAVFIRRRFGSDQIYWAVFTEYLSLLLQSGCMLECFIEGGRSRSGKSIAPKSGFLEVIAQLVLEGVVPDVTLVPIGISYDRMVEGKSFVRELLGNSKEKESLFGFLRAAKEVVKLHLGSIDLAISDKFISLRSYLGMCKHQLSGPSAKRSRALTLATLSYTALYEADVATVVTASSLVASVLLTSRTRGIQRTVVIDRVTQLVEDLKRRGARLSHLLQTEPIALVVDGAIAMFGRLVTLRNGVISGYWFAESLELGIYRNAVIHWWVAEACVAVALVADHRHRNLDFGGKQQSHGVSRSGLLERVRFVSQLMKTEFVFKPTFNIEENFRDVTASLIAKRFLGENSDGSLCVDERGIKYFSFLCMLIWPLIDTYWSCCMTLMKLPKGAIIDASALTAKASVEAEQFFYKGEVAFYESVSTDCVRQAFKWFEVKKILLAQPVIEENKASKASQLLRLGPEYEPPGGKGSCNERLKQLADTIAEYRADAPQTQRRPFSLASRM